MEPEAMSKSFLVVVALLVIPTVYWFWSDQQKKDRRTAEIDRQNRIAEKIYDTIYRFAESPSGVTEHEARIATDLISEEHLSSNRHRLLFEYYLSALRCHLGRKYGGGEKTCRKMLDSQAAAMHS